VSRLHIIIVGVLLFVVSCKPTTPSQYIQPDEIVDILVDYHLARAIGQMQPNYEEQNYERTLYWNAVMKKHNITQEQFDSSLTYYYSRADRFDDIYRRVYQRLDEENTLLGISEGEIGKYAALKADGDTANIWPGRQSQAMMPLPPYDYYNFIIDCDSTFFAGDTFLMQFTSDYVYQSGSKDGILYLAVDYPDTTVVRQTRFTYSGLIQLRADIDERVKSIPQRIKGFFYLGGAHDRSSVVRLLFLNNIQLIRFHKKHEEAAPVEADSLSQDTIARRTIDGTVGSGDSVGTSSKILPIKRGASPNRVVERIDSIKSSK